MPDVAAVRSVLAKELREARRDRNLLLNVVLVPLFLYPLLGFGILQVLLIVRGVSEKTTTVIAITGDVPAAVRDSVEAGERVRLLEVPAAVPVRNAATFRAWRDANAKAGDVPQVLLSWRHTAAGDSAHIFYDSSRDRSRDAHQRLQTAIDAWRHQKALRAMKAVGLGEADLEGFDLTSENTASATQRGRQLLASGLPLVLLLMIAVGTATASLDVVVGERERGTLETILVSPLARIDVLIGKYLFVVLAAVTAFALNLLSMSIFLGFALKLVDVGEEIRVSIDPASCLLMFGAAALTAAFLAAVFMIIAVPSRTYREGQAALSPAYLLAMVPGLVVGASSEPFGLREAVIPVLNATALFEAVLEGEVSRMPVLVTYATLAACTVLALAVAARIGRREDVFLEPRVSLGDMLRGKGAS